MKLTNLKFQLLKNFNINEKRECDILHLILKEEFVEHRFEAKIKLVKIYAALPTTNSEIERGSKLI